MVVYFGIIVFQNRILEIFFYVVKPFLGYEIFQFNISTMPIEYAPECKKLYNREICNEMKINVPDGYSPIE